MLILRRRPGESILLGPDIEIEILEVSPGRVKLGIKAPATVAVLRKEIQEAAAHNLAAARTLTAGTLRRLAGTLGSACPSGR